MRKVVPWVALAAVFAACSSGSSGASGSVSADEAVGHAATALCQKFNTCSAFFVQLEYGDVDTCASATKSSLASALAAAQTGETPAQVEACANAVAGASCDDAVGHNLPAACQPVAGRLALGDPCGDSSQCLSAFCHKQGSSTCGACSVAPAVGASCTSDDACPTGNVCSKAGTCSPEGTSGAACDPIQRPCKPTLVCKNGFCAAPDEAGTPCTKTTTSSGSADTCDALAGLYCNAQATTGTCVKIVLVDAGMPCLLVNDTLTLCSAAGTCNVPTMSATTGTCLAAASPGATCMTSPTSQSEYGYALTASDCASPAKCDNGVCTVPDPSTCH